MPEKFPSFPQEPAVLDPALDTRFDTAPGDSRVARSQSSQREDTVGAANLIRCPWATKEPEITYHDVEWGVPQHNDRMLFELLILEGAQAGLSWETILRKREGYRAAFDGFDPRVVAQFDAARIEALVADARIVRHRGKIVATVKNAAAFLEVQRTHGSFATYLWKFVDDRPIVTRWAATDDLPARTDLSDRVSADLKSRGFTFVGSTIIYAYLQATGVIDDHRITCFRARPSTTAKAKREKLND